MLTPIRSSTFKADVKRQKKRGKDLNKLKVLIELLIKEEQIPADYVDHPLIGNWRGYRDAHIEGDWLLIYKITGQELKLARTGSHQDIFSQY
ncbi:type II toxin-antitoxin system YafQ family toxin (plasmid) [Providencia rettgeri]|uniref:mRNA interferase toxin YafQ n=1 Tax=Providencia rettgeri TaxID=587 RepID=A0A379LQK1_PRORE|nr:type II toxin-antitoxin system YafQ family toxin [Providencia rettgeri]QXB07801.1 type II toxin-antitoxin system YafQ family toxin [Providencia rettgeri]SUD99035.1 mRNA interferase YafQ [Providencia rettgeri]